MKTKTVKKAYTQSTNRVKSFAETLAKLLSINKVQIKPGGTGFSTFRISRTIKRIIRCGCQCDG